MFFAKNLIFVEGLTEQLLLPAFAEALNISLTDNHISIINVNGRYFNHFLKLFDRKRSEFAIPKKIACLADLDPVMKLKKKDVTEEDNDDNSNEKNAWKSCFTFMINSDTDYDYKKSSNLITEQYQGRKDEDAIRVYTQLYGSTFEYELLFENYACAEIITTSVSNNDEIKAMMKIIKEDMSKDDLFKLLKTIRKGSFRDIATKYSNDDSGDYFTKSRHIIAARYLKSIDKGEIAQELTSVILDSVENDRIDGKGIQFMIPSYIERMIKWICQ